jgi:tetratricopeptide (TPR) repeat protein
VEKQTDPVVSTLGAYTRGAQRDRWLYSELDKGSSDPKKITSEIDEAAMRFFEEAIAVTHNRNAWVRFIQGELRRRYAVLLAMGLPRDRPPEPRVRRHLELLSGDFYGALGLAEGLMKNDRGYSTGAVVVQLDKARDLMPSDAPKEHLSRFFYIRGALRANLGDRRGAMEDLETALSVWRRPINPAIATLEDLYREAGDLAALERLQERVKSLKPVRS